MCKEVYLYRSFEPQIMRFSLDMNYGGNEGDGLISEEV
jgi:hypothetical protein